MIAKRVSSENPHLYFYLFNTFIACRLTSRSTGRADAGLVLRGRVGGGAPVSLDVRPQKQLRASIKSRSNTFQEVRMIGYITLGTNDLERAKLFYDALLFEMGVKRLMDFGDRGYGWAASLDQPMLCIFKPYDGRPASVGNGVMAGISADSRETVDRVHRKALELGGIDEGKPGLRAEGGEGFYAAYFRDLDGNKLDVFCYG